VFWKTYTASKPLTQPPVNSVCRKNQKSIDQGHECRALRSDRRTAVFFAGNAAAQKVDFHTIFPDLFEAVKIKSLPETFHFFLVDAVGCRLQKGFIQFALRFFLPVSGSVKIFSKNH
jgi:hypothetical protein